MAYRSSYTGAQVDTAIQKVASDGCKVQYGNLTGNISNQIDLMEKFNSVEACKLTVATSNSTLVIKLGDTVQTFNNVVALLNEKRYTFVEYNGDIYVPSQITPNTSVVFSNAEIINSFPNIKCITMGSNNAVTVTTIQGETTNNKVTSISSASTDTQYPSAKTVYSIVGDINAALEEIIGE